MSDIGLCVKFLFRVNLAFDFARANAVDNCWHAIQEIVLLFLLLDALIKNLLRALFQPVEKRLARACAHLSA